MPPGAEAPGPNGGGIESIGPIDGDGEWTTCPPSRADARREKALAAPAASEPETSCKKVRRPFTSGRYARSMPRPCGSSIHVPSSPSSARWGIELAKVAVCKLDFPVLREERSFAPHPIAKRVRSSSIKTKLQVPPFERIARLLRKRCVAAQTLHRPHRRAVTAIARAPRAHRERQKLLELWRSCPRGAPRLHRLGPILRDGVAGESAAVERIVSCTECARGDRTGASVKEPSS